MKEQIIKITITTSEDGKKNTIQITKDNEITYVELLGFLETAKYKILNEMQVPSEIKPERELTDPNI